MRPQARLLTGGLSAALGLALVWLSIHLIPGLCGALLDALRSVVPLLASLVLVTTFTNLWLTAHKWRLITDKIIDTDPVSTWTLMDYVTTSALLAQLLPRQLGLIGVRSLALRHLGIASVRRGLLSVMYDLLFDLTIPLLLLLPSTMLLLGLIPMSLAVVLSLILLILAILTVGLWYPAACRCIIQAHRMIWRRMHGEHDLAADTGTQGFQQVFEPDLARRLFLLALVRYCNLILRSFLVAKSGSLPIGLLVVALPYPLLQLTFLASITPAGLGITEWTWIGLLRLQDVQTATAGAFALLHRSLVVGAVAVVGCGLVIVRTWRGVLGKATIDRR